MAIETKDLNDEGMRRRELHTLVEELDDGEVKDFTGLLRRHLKSRRAAQARDAEVAAKG